MRLSLILLLVALVAPTGTLAARGEKRTPGQSSLRALIEEKDKDPFKPSNKKKGKKCKKAKKSKKGTKDKSEDNGIRRHAEVIFDHTDYCLHSKSFTEEQCAQVKQGHLVLPQDGSIKGNLNLEIVHGNDLTSNDILTDVSGVLSQDTNPRFVGCEEMEGPPKKKSKKGQNSRRRLAEYKLVDEEEDTVDVTGVSFNSLDILPGDCTKDTLPEGAVCDTIKSNVEIFYIASDGPITLDEEEDMYNLLKETITAQAKVGSFDDAGSVADVTVTTNGQTDGGDSDETVDRGSLGEVPDPSGGATTFEDHKIPILVAAFGFAVLFAGGYWYSMGSDDDNVEEKNEQTDDSDSDNDSPLS